MKNILDLLNLKKITSKTFRSFQHKIWLPTWKTVTKYFSDLVYQEENGFMFELLIKIVDILRNRKIKTKQIIIQVRQNFRIK